MFCFLFLQYVSLHIIHMRTSVITSPRAFASSPIKPTIYILKRTVFWYTTIFYSWLLNECFYGDNLWFVYPRSILHISPTLQSSVFVEDFIYVFLCYHFSSCILCNGDFRHTRTLCSVCIFCNSCIAPCVVSLQSHSQESILAQNHNLLLCVFRLTPVASSASS